MKPIHLNLAARPYRDYRPVYAVIAATALLTAFLMVNNASTYYRYTSETRSTRARIAEAEAQTRREREKNESVQHRLRNLDLTRLDARTRYINARLTERTFSWSTLLDELESVLPRDVRLVSIAPAFGSDGTVSLSLALQAKAADGMIETINRMQADPQFDNPFPSSESVIPGGFQFALTVRYLPPASRAAGEVTR